MRILLTGGRGMMGTDMLPVLTEAGHHVDVTDIDDLDVRDRDAITTRVKATSPDLLIHLAALTDVDGCEKYPDDAYRTNALGTQNVALVSHEANTKMVYLSTISVFDGTKCEPYTEFDTPNPQSHYARSKYQGELFVKELHPHHYIVRAGWMFGGGPEDKKFVAKIIELAGNRSSLSVVDDKFGSPTYTVDISCGILRLVETGFYGTYHMVNAGAFCNRKDFAQAILEIAGVSGCELQAVSSAHFPLPAPRPRMEAARNYQLELRGYSHWMRPWRQALEEYVTERLVISADS